MRLWCGSVGEVNCGGAGSRLRQFFGRAPVTSAALRLRKGMRVDDVAGEAWTLSIWDASLVLKNASLIRGVLRPRGEAVFLAFLSVPLFRPAKLAALSV